MADPSSELTYAEAEEIGADLHDHWEKIEGAPPIERGSLAWADMVQFVARRARARVAARDGA